MKEPISFAKAISPEKRKITIVLLLGTLLMVTFRYFGSREFYQAHLLFLKLAANADFAAESYVFFSSFLLLGCVPIAVIKLIFKENLSDHGLGLGDWRYGIKCFALLSPCLVLASYFASRDPAFISEYPIYKSAGTSSLTFVNHILRYFLYYIGWEIFFRGFMQFGLQRQLGVWNAILIQTLASTLIHIGKPAGEIYGAILGGIAWGIVSYRANSIMPGLLMHWILGASLDFFICFHRA